MALLDPNNIIPLYYQLKELLKEKIKEGSWGEGQKVPSERELMERYQVSRATARKALSELLVEGLIFRKQGIGTFVSKSKVVQNLIGELSFNQQVIKQGLTPSSIVISATLERTVPNRIMDIFKQEKSIEIFKIVRVRQVNDEPLILESLYIPHKYAPSILSQELEKVAVIEYLKNEYQIDFTHSNLDIEPVATNEFESQYLKTDIGIPALSLERVIYSGKKAVIFQKRIMRGDRGKFSFVLGESPFRNDEYILGLDLTRPHQS